MAMGGYGWVCVVIGGYGWLWELMGGYGWLWVVIYFIYLLGRSTDKTDSLNFVPLDIVHNKLDLCKYIYTSFLRVRRVTPASDTCYI